MFGRNRIPFTVLVIVAAMVFALTGAQFALAATDGTYNYTISGGNARIDLYIGPGGAVAIPSTLGGAPVTAIGDHAFEGQVAVTGVTIPNGVTSIGFSSLAGTRLTSVTIPDSVTSIGVWAFQLIPTLTNVTIGSGVTSISPFAFSGCPLLTAATFMGNAPTTMGAQVFGPGSGPAGFKVYVINGKTGFVAPPGPWLGYTTAYYAW